MRKTDEINTMFGLSLILQFPEFKGIEDKRVYFTNETKTLRLPLTAIFSKEADILATTDLDTLQQAERYKSEADHNFRRSRRSGSSSYDYSDYRSKARRYSDEASRLLASVKYFPVESVALEQSSARLPFSFDLMVSTLEAISRSNQSMVLSATLNKENGRLEYRTDTLGKNTIKPLG